MTNIQRPTPPDLRSWRGYRLFLRGDLDGHELAELPTMPRYTYPNDQLLTEILRRLEEL